MPYGKVVYDKLADAYLCEFPIRKEDGRMHICGKWFRDLVRHITRYHKISVRQYKKMLGLDMKESLMSEQTKKKLREFNNKYQSYKNLEKGEKFRFKPGENKIQKYERSEQTKNRLRSLKLEKKRKK